jgi:hypothetical protein
MTRNCPKRHYDAPTISRIGSLSELTKGFSSGAFLDASFPVGTPDPDLTFSGA